ncbi:MAG: dTDP-4-dehydrorhamnose reductase [Clostridia bacterium]|nr:dTDP-4-dehydrorhamnose reductase [Clostridia bacterium]
MKVLVTGYAGQLGYDTVRLLEARGIDCRGVDMADFDLTDGQAVKDYVQTYHPTAIVHCAGYTSVDKAESQPEICAAVNGMGTVNIVRAALAVGAKVVFISTDYVFPGTGDQPWKINDPYGPRNVYGMSKVQGEDAVRSLITRYFILRTSWVFGKNGSNFVRTMIRLGKEKREIRVVNDQIGSPTYTKDLARVICDMLMTEKYGIYHVRNEGFMSWYDFAKMIMEKTGLPCRVLPVPSSEYPTPAKRPLNSRLDGSKLAEAGFEPMPPVEDALDRYLEEIRDEVIS